MTTPPTLEQPAPPAATQQPWERQTHAYNVLHVRLRIVLDEVLAARPRRVFEIGCGVGVLRAELLRRDPAIDYHGCDVSHSAVKQIGDSRVVAADLNAEPLPFDGRRFDCVAGSGILEYIRDVPALLRTARTRLDAGGRLVVSYFNMDHLRRRLGRLRGRPPYRHPAWANDYSFADLRRVLRTAGFAVERELPSSVGLGGSPAIGRERFGADVMRAIRGVPGVRLLAHQMVFVCTAVEPAELPNHA